MCIRDRHWTEYPTENTTDYQNLTWAFDFTPPKPGFYRMKIRAVNDRGEASPEAAYVELDLSLIHICFAVPRPLSRLRLRELAVQMVRAR